MERFGLKRHAVRQILAELEALGAVEKSAISARWCAPSRRARSWSCTRCDKCWRCMPPARSRCPCRRRGWRRWWPQRKHDAAVADGDARRVFRSNQRFHRELFGLLDNAVLGQAIEEYARRTHPIRFGSLASPGYRERARQEHWAMIHALRDGDRDALMALCRDHLLPSRDAYLASERARLGA